MERIALTSRGYNVLQEELKHRLQTVRPQIIAAIEEARAHGDLSENAEYHAAKEQQSFNEGRIQELESVTGRAQVIDPTEQNGSTAKLSATVTVADDDDKEHTFVLVGAEEADSEKNLISVTSPLGRALIGKEEGDEAIVRAPGGTRNYEIIEVAFKAIEV